MGLTNSILRAAVLIALGATSASAQTLPRYAVEAHCKTVSDFSGGSMMIYNSCVDMEQTAYRSLQQKWAGLPRRTIDHCDEVARFAGESYSILESCITMETDAANSVSTFDY